MEDLSPLHMPQAKLCTLCHTFKDWDEFGIRRSQKDGKNYSCIPCTRQQNTKGYQRNRPIRLQRAFEYRQPRKAELCLYQQNYRQRFPEKARKVCRNWRKANPGQKRLIEQNREAKKRGLPHTWTTEEQAFMLRYWNNACAVCGNSEGLFWILADDHWIPLASPNCPGTIATNMIPLCHGNGGCNNSKHKNEPHAWLLRRFGAKKAAQIEKAVATYFALVAITFPKKGNRS